MHGAGVRGYGEIRRSNVRMLGMAMQWASALELLLICSWILVTVHGSPESERDGLKRFMQAVGNYSSINTSWRNDTAGPCQWLGVHCTNDSVHQLNLRGLNLTGEIPDKSFGQLPNLTQLNLKGNSLSGSFPSELFTCTALKSIILRDNKFSGSLPSGFTRLVNLLSFDASMNSFTGSIPESLLHLKDLDTLDLSDNHLNGSIPEVPTWSLTNFNVSNNNLTGALPAGYSRFSASSYLNTFLCGDPHPPCPQPPPPPPPRTKQSHNITRVAIATIVLGILLALIVPLLLFFAFRKTKTSSAESGTDLPLLSSTHTLDPARSVPFSTKGSSSTDVDRRRWLTFFKADSNFDLDVLLEGTAVALQEGTLGNSFKVELQSGESYVVKKFKKVGIDQPAFDESMRKLGSQRHDNLLPIIAYFCGREEKLLVTKYMENGSLMHRLRDNAGGKKSLAWDTRIRIAVGTAKGIKYLHEHDLLHGNIKSSNILLSSNDDACLSDYGLAEIVSARSGYPDAQMAPTSNLRFKEDIGQFGSLLSELFKTELQSSSTYAGDGETLSPNSAQPFVESKGEGRGNVADRLRRIVKNCLNGPPESRPAIQELLKELRKVEIGDHGKHHCLPTP
ncbi:hypothetical protein KP509_12G053200 [Ceratopteris richardii]|uniref:Protein kinase domain-containing protein n=1 Tax=Ceratopteris richardii TaxID=49495 RepID=A0A8T2TNL6_CERRI|nr:hypothetical protein KP509_12G053200 [Ceratopteris richardii]